MVYKVLWWYQMKMLEYTIHHGIYILLSVTSTKKENKVLPKNNGIATEAFYYLLVRV